MNWALEWLKEIGKLFVLNNKRFTLWQEGKDFGPDWTEALRKLVNHVQKLEKRWTDELKQPNLHKKQMTVLTSLKKHWEGLTIFLEDPRIPLRRVNDWRGCFRARGVSVVRMLSRFFGVSIQSVTPFPVAARQTGHAHLAHPAFTCNIKPSLSASRRAYAAACIDQASRRDTRRDIGDTPCLAVRVCPSTIAVSAVRCIS